MRNKSRSSNEFEAKRVRTNQREREREKMMMKKKVWMIVSTHVLHVWQAMTERDGATIKQQKPELFRQSKRSVTWQVEDEIFIRYSSHSEKKKKKTEKWKTNKEEKQLQQQI